MATDVFEVVSHDQIPEILKTFEKDWPKYFPLKQYVTILSEYKKAKVNVPKYNLYKYGDIGNGVYLIEYDFTVEGKVKFISYFIFTASDDLLDLRNSLMETSRIQWANKHFLFEVTLERFADVVTEVARAKGIELDNKQNYMMWHPKPVDCKTVPEDMYITKLDNRHMEEVNSTWPHRFPNSEIYLSHQLSNNFGLGLFRKTDKKLICSVFTFQSGGLFTLHTHPEFRGKGYAEIIIRNMSSELQKLGRVPFATILLENIPSQKVFARSGFQHFNRVSFLLNMPKP